MVKNICLSLLSLFLFIACASHSNPTLLNQELIQFSALEREANKEIDSINKDMVAIIETHKKNMNNEAYYNNVENVQKHIKLFIADIKKRSSSFTHPSIKEYSNIAIEKLEIEMVMSSDIFSQYIEGGEFNKKDNRKLRSKNLKKLRKLKEKEDKVLLNIKEELSKDSK